VVCKTENRFAGDWYLMNPAHATFVAAALLLCSFTTAADRPNIIVIYTDDHGYSDMACQGIQKDLITPNIDALAAGGVRMTSGYVTAPQCVPSRAGLLSD
jgi:hypothetical protein